MKKAQLNSSAALPAEIIIKNACTVDLDGGPNLSGLSQNISIEMYARGGHVRLTVPDGIVLKPRGGIRLNDGSGLEWPGKHIRRVRVGSRQVWPPEPVPHPTV